MARGTTTDYLTTQCTAGDILEDAYRMIGVLKPGHTIAQAPDVPRALRVLNSLIKRDAQDGLHTWALTEGVLFLTANQARYEFGTAVCGTYGTYNRTTLDAAEATAQTVLSVTSTTGMTAADKIAVELDDGTLQWSTINTYSDGDTVTLDDALTGDAASGNTVYWYTTNAEIPIRIVPGTVRLETASGTEQIVWMISRSEYMTLASKDTSGYPSRAYFDRQYNSAYLYLWPVPDSVDYTLRFTYQRTLKDIDTYRDDFDIPQEGALYYTKAVAAELAISFGVDPGIVQMLKQEAGLERESFLGFTGEQGSVFIHPGQ